MKHLSGSKLVALTRERTAEGRWREGQMHARLSRFAGLGPERIEATIREFEEESLPRLEQQPGFKGITVGVNYQSGQAVSIALWETEGDMDQSEQLAAEAREQAVATGGPSRPPILDHFEVVIHR